MTEWSVPKGRRRCDGCERPFQPGDALWSALRLDGSALRRDDRCPDCHAAAPVADPLCRWRTTAPSPDQPKRSRLDMEAAADLLKRLAADADPAHRALCYVLALGLVRRRVLKIAGSEPGPEPTAEELAVEQSWRDAVAAQQAALAAAQASEPPDGPPPEAPAVPPRPPPRPIGWLLLAERDAERPLRVAELALADDQIAAVTAQLRELFEGDV